MRSRCAGAGTAACIVYMDHIQGELWCYSKELLFMLALCCLHPLVGASFWVVWMAMPSVRSSVSVCGEFTIGSLFFSIAYRRVIRVYQYEVGDDLSGRLRFPLYSFFHWFSVALWRFSILTHTAEDCCNGVLTYHTLLVYPTTSTGCQPCFQYLSHPEEWGPQVSPFSRFASLS